MLKIKVDLIAKLKNTTEFMKVFKDGDDKNIFEGKSLIFYSLSNTDLISRYEISNFLLDKNIDVLCKNSEGETVLHVLLGQRKNDIEETYRLCKRLIEKGVNINEKDEKGRVALFNIIQSNKSDEELEKLYDLWFSYPNLDLTSKDSTGVSAIEYARKFPFRASLIERMEKYESKGTY
ncbi:MAG: ankyrin repeat domain-containing protein [Psychrobacillus psychrodurans]